MVLDLAVRVCGGVLGIEEPREEHRQVRLVAAGAVGLGLDRPPWELGNPFGSHL
jgi:hypothetical protein